MERENRVGGPYIGKNVELLSCKSEGKRLTSSNRSSRFSAHPWSNLEKTQNTFEHNPRLLVVIDCSWLHLLTTAVISSALHTL